MAAVGWRASVALGIAAVLLSACSASGTSSEEVLPAYDPVPRTVDQPAIDVDATQLRVPRQLAERQVVDPGWQTPPHGVDGVFLSAGHTADVLTFRAVDVHGTVLWEADRPLSCTGFTLTTANEQHSAVLTDIDAPVQTFGDTVAAAYDLHTGQHVWGPVQVPGPHHGPGTVFAAPSDQAMGASGPRVVLDPATGEVLLDERQTPDVQILGEFHGTVLIADDAQVQAHSATALAESGLTTQPLWSLPIDDSDWDTQRLSAVSPTPNPGVEDGAGAVLLGTDDTNRALVSLADGEVLADRLAAAGQDPSSQTWVTIGQHLAAYDVTGQALYEEPHDGLDIVGVGAAIAYVKNTDGDVEARNVVTGSIGRSYDPQDTGTLTVPRVITATGAGILDGGGAYYLVPLQEADHAEP